MMHGQKNIKLFFIDHNKDILCPALRTPFIKHDSCRINRQ